MQNEKTSRRQALRNLGMLGVSAAAGAVAIKGFAQSTTPDPRIQTPAQTEGPFYPVVDQLDKDADMTQVQNHTDVALGERVYLTGTVIDVQTGAPIAGAVVEFWQACASGKYDHPEDPNDAPLDPNFQYWAQVQTDAVGRYSLTTIKPGAYQASANWRRPPHIHIKVHRTGYPSLTTQIYWQGDALNARDHILQAIPRAQQNLVVVDFAKEAAASGDISWAGTWNIYIQKFRRGRSGAKVQKHLATPELD